MTEQTHLEPQTQDMIRVHGQAGHFMTLNRRSLHLADGEMREEGMEWTEEYPVAPAGPPTGPRF